MTMFTTKLGATKSRREESESKRASTDGTCRLVLDPSPSVSHPLLVLLGPWLSRSHLLAMTRPPTPSIGLLLLLIGYAAAGPEPDVRTRAMHSSACQEHNNLHSRLDVVEKKVEETVEKLEVELASLLDAVEAPKWRPLLDNAGQTAVVDILEDPGQRGQS